MRVALFTNVCHTNTNEVTMSQTQGELIAAILADPKAHGFTFNTEVVKSDGHTFPAEIVVVQDVTKFDASFPGVALSHLNGSSTRVGSQAISRLARGKQKPEELRQRNIKWLLGIEESGKRTVYVGPEGAEFDSIEEAEAAWLEYAETLQKA